MKGLAVAGIVLMLIGVVGFAYGRLSYTTNEKVLDLGPLQVTAAEKHTLPIPDIAAGIALVAGLVLVVMGTRKA